MPLQNRVLPTGDIIATPARGRMTGNRGILHGPDRVLGRARWRHKAWICCVLDWQGRRRQVMTGRNWTELFFLDEAVALSAGHRPCAYCRRADYTRFQTAWAAAHGTRLKAVQMDAILHAARVGRDRRQIRHQAPGPTLPDGSFIIDHDQPCLIAQGQIWPYAPTGYGPPRGPTPRTEATVLTPAPIVAILSAGYRPLLGLPQAND